MQIPSLVHLFEQKESHFFDSVLAWLGKLEKLLENNRNKLCSDIAILRGTLISIERGRAPEGITFTRSKSQRKVMDAAAVDALKKANELITGMIQGPLAQINEAERLIRQIVPIAELKGLLNPSGASPDHSANLKEIWRQLLADPELAAVGIHIKGLVSNNDVLILLDRVMVSS
ncbi:MAG: hypothetical protein ACYCX4_08055 [Bacillota bacterium]